MLSDAFLLHCSLPFRDTIENIRCNMVWSIWDEIIKCLFVMMRTKETKAACVDRIKLQYYTFFCESTHAFYYYVQWSVDNL